MLKCIKPLYLPYRLIKNLLTQLPEYRKIDTFFVSPPKTGRTWLRVILAKIFSEHFGVPLTLDIVEWGRAHKDCPKIIFTHDLSAPELRDRKIKISTIKYRNKNIVFLARDPRDQAVSYYFEISKRYGGYPGNISDFIRDPHYGIARVINFMNTWINHQKKVSRFLLMRYEDLKQDTPKEIKKLMDFIEMGNIQDEIMQNAVQFATFDNMKQLERQNFFNTDALKPQNIDDNESYKVRRGKIGGYKDYLSSLDVRYVNSEMQWLDNAFGYNA